MPEIIRNAETWRQIILEFKSDTTYANSFLDPDIIVREGRW